MTRKDTSKIKLDFTTISIVVKCSHCDWWFGFALDRVEGWTVGARHQRDHHPGNQQAEKNLLKARFSAGVR